MKTETLITELEAMFGPSFPINREPEYQKLHHEAFCAALSGFASYNPRNVERALKMADEYIKQLKERSK